MTDAPRPRGGRPRREGAPAQPSLRMRLVDLSVISVSALILGGAVLVIADVDHAREPAVTMAVAAPAQLNIASASVAPVPGLVPAPAPRARRVVVLRRSRAS